MYHIRRPDRGEEGPHSVDTLRMWLEDGRVTAGTPARLALDDEWKPLGEFPDFAIADQAIPGSVPAPLAGSAPPPLPPFPAPQRIPAVAFPRTSGLAVVSLALGLIGIFGVTGIVGFICGVVALGQIRRSGGALKGRGLALAGMLLAVLMLALLVAGVFIAVNMTRSQQGGFRYAPPNDCSSNLSQLGYVMRVYANDHGDLLPAATNWCDSVREYTPSLGVFTCPNALSTRRSSFAFNAALSGRNIDEVNPQTVLLFESDADWNGAGGSELVPSSPSVRGQIFVCFANGSTRKISREVFSKLRWNP